jgi:hypothetical protein
MKNRTITIITIVMLIVVGTISFSSVGINIKITKNSPANDDGKAYGQDDGKAYGQVETIGRCMPIGIPDLRLACGRNLIDFRTTFTDEDGFFEFCNLTYDDTGTTYIVWIPPGQGIVFRGYLKFTLNKERPEKELYYFITCWLNSFINA